MKEEERIASINQVISSYFEKKKEEHSVSANKLMPDFIEAGIFVSDQKNGLPIRKVLRTLDEQGALDKIPLLHPERKDKNTLWYFVREGSTYSSDAPNDTGVTRKQKRRAVVLSSDEYYLVNLCDELLQEQAFRQHKFPFLLGDHHKDGKTRTPLLVDAYYEDHNLVIEFTGSTDTESVESSDKRDRTIGGVSLSAQRKIYAERKRKGLVSNDIDLLEIPYASFECNDEKQLMRNQEKDVEVLKGLLIDCLSTDH